MEDKEDNKFDDNEFNYQGELTKIEESGNGNIYIAGICTTEKMDHDGEIVDLTEVRRVWDDYLTNPVLKYMHGKDPSNMAAIGMVVPSYTDSVGKIWKTEFTDQGPFIVCKISNAPDTESIRTKVTEGILKGFSIGGRARRVKTFDPTLQKDVNRVITTRISEVSLVDLPANSDSFFSVLKAACVGDNCPLNDNTEPIEKTMDTEYIEESDPVVDEAVAKFESIILENTQMHERLDKLESEIHDMITNYDTEVLKIEDNKTDNNLIEINLGEL